MDYIQKFHASDKIHIQVFTNASGGSFSEPEQILPQEILHQYHFPHIIIMTM